MKWRGRRGSRNVEDRRGRGGKMAGGGLGLGALILLGASILFPDAVPLLQMLGVGGPQQQQISTNSGGVDDEHREFISVVLKDTEDVWNQEFAKAGTIHLERTDDYPEPTVVVFGGQTMSPCGPASTASGPFYCPGDNKIYIDPGFYQVMDRQLGAKGDFARAYVIAHEVAHHVQNVTGRIPQVDAYRKRSSKLDANRATVRLELQADCYSGVWTNRKRDVLEKGDVEEALNAAFRIGDDTLQRRSGHVNPATFTHGTSEQRVQWFFKGLNAGDIAVCDTFSQPYDAL